MGTPSSTVGVRGHGQSLLHGPTVVQTLIKSVEFNASDVRPLGQGSACAVQGQIAMPRTMNRGREGAFDSPAQVKDSIMQGWPRNTDLVSPFLKGKGRAVMREKAPISLKPKFKPTASIAALFEPSSPTHVAGTVMTVVVDSVKAVDRGRPRPDVSQEVSKGGPFVANADSASSIVAISLNFGQAATSVHVAPSLIFGGLGRCRHSRRVYTKGVRYGDS